MKVNLTRGGKQLSPDELSALLSLDVQEDGTAVFEPGISSKAAGRRPDATSEPSEDAGLGRIDPNGFSKDAERGRNGVRKFSDAAEFGRSGTSEPGEGIGRRSLFSDADHLKAMDKIHAWVCVRERTCKECYERLVDLEFDREVAVHAVDRAVECGLIDEVRYASAYIKGKVRAGWGRGRIVRKLEENCVPASVVDECAEFFATPQEEYERALREIEKRPARSKNPKATYVRRLLQKGYSQDIALRAVSEFLCGSKESCA